MLSARVAHDARADGGRWTLVLDPDFVIISRRVNGMRMHLSVPIVHYDGVAIAENKHPEGALYRIRLVHPDPELCVPLKESRDRPFSLDAWAAWAAFFAAPAFVEDINDRRSVARIAGARRDVELPAHRSALSGNSAVRGAAGLSAKPFLRSRARSGANRKTDGNGRLGPVIRGEREIISYE